jgi:hypothetical protein
MTKPSASNGGDGFIFVWFSTEHSQMEADMIFDQAGVLETLKSSSMNSWPDKIISLADGESYMPVLNEAGELSLRCTPFIWAINPQQ